MRGHLSCHACPLPCMPTLPCTTPCHTCPPHACSPPCMPPFSHAHPHPLPCMPLSPHMPPCGQNDRHLWKHYFSTTTVADSNKMPNLNKHVQRDYRCSCYTSSGRFRGVHPARAPPWPKIFSISCSFLENLTKSYVGTPPEGRRPLLQGILDLPLPSTVHRTWCIIPAYLDPHWSSTYY